MGDSDYWSDYDEWKAQAKKSFFTILLRWEWIVDHDANNWGIQKGVEQAAKELDWANRDANNTCKEAYKKVNRRALRHYMERRGYGNGGTHETTPIKRYG